MELKIKDIALIAVLSAILVVLQIALNFLPNIHLVSLLIIVYSLVLGRKTLYIIYIFALLQGVIYGFGIWWIMYLYVWTILFLIVRIFKKNESTIIWAVISAFHGLAFGALCSIPYFIIGGIGAGIAWWIAGIPFDIVHGISNFIIALLLFRPTYMIMTRLSDRY